MPWHVPVFLLWPFSTNPLSNLREINIVQLPFMIRTHSFLKREFDVRTFCFSSEL